MAILLRVEDVSLGTGKHDAAFLQNINLTVRTGEMVAVCGNSGSGKSCLVDLITGVQKPDTGQVERSGLVAWVAQEFLLYKDLTVQENLEFFSQVNGYQGELETLVQWSGLKSRRNVLAKRLSTGGKKMLQLAVALTRDAALWVLDEPEVGMDEQQTAVLQKMLQELKVAGKGIIVMRAASVAEGSYDQVFQLLRGTLVRVNPFQTQSVVAQGRS